MELHNSQVSIQEQILLLMKRRKGQVNTVLECLNSDECYFLKCFRIGDSVAQYVQNNAEKSELFLRNLYLFGVFIGETLEQPNTEEKLKNILQLCEEYAQFSMQKVNYQVATSVRDLPQIILGSALTLTQTPTEGSIPPLQFNKKHTILGRFSVAAKTFQLPEKMNFYIVLESFCMILDLLYITFADNAFVINSHCLELITRIDAIIAQRFFSVVFEVFLKTAQTLVGEEFAKLNEMIFDGEKHLEHSRLDDLVNQFDSLESDAQQQLQSQTLFK